MNRQLYLEWFPQIMYNHHQTGPEGAVLFAPPFRDPFNYHFDPLIPLQIEMVGAAMHSRFAAEGKPGATMRSGAPYSTWYNGGLRTDTYFHNMIGLLTETIGSPTPMDVPLVPQRQLATGDLPFPVPPQKWHFRQSIEYSMTANRAVLDLASKYREDFLFHIYRMGRNSIERGSRDSWTVTPKRIEALREAGRERGTAGLRQSGGLHLRTPRGSRSRQVLRTGAARSRTARPPRIHHSVLAAGLRHRHKVHQHAGQERHRHRARHSGFRTGRKALSQGVLGRENRAGVPPAHSRHVRTAGPPERLPVPGWAAHSSVRCHRLHARVPDGGGVRSRSGRGRGPVRKSERAAEVPRPGGFSVRNSPPDTCSATR